MASANTASEEKNIWKVVRVAGENSDVNSLFLEGKDEKFTARKAGQFVSIRVPAAEGWSEPHPFTISAAPEDNLLRLTIKKEGVFTSAIPSLTPGTPVKVMGPLGVFCQGIDDRPEIVMLAGGVGITPFLSVLRHFRTCGAKNLVILFWSNKTLADVFCREEIAAMTGELPLNVVHCLSREDDVQSYFDARIPGVKYEKGRLNAEIMKKHGVKENAAYYVCGPPPMMDTALKELESLGVDPAQVEQERFVWKK